MIIDPKITIGNILTLITLIASMSIGIWKVGVLTGELEADFKQVESQIVAIQQDAKQRDVILRNLDERESFLNGEVNDGQPRGRR